MRARVLSDPSIAALLEEAFVCAWEKKGAVECYRVKGSPDDSFKVGGNILSYVCTPRGEVLHAIPGTWRPEHYKEHLAWARTLHRELAGLKPEVAAAHVRTAHRDRHPVVARWKAQELLASEAFRPLAEVEKSFFETLLDETYQPDKEIIIREVSASDYRDLVASMPRSG